MASPLSTTTTIPIAQLQPDLDAKDETSVTGIVTLIWPYASLTQSLSLLLVEPDFRLRRHRGQVRIHFHGSSAKAVARSGVSSGDQLSLSLIGADWAKDGCTATTPGRGIEWELQYAERVILEIHRSSEGSTSVDVDHPPPSPPPESPKQTSTPRHSPPYNSHIATSTRKALNGSLKDTQAWSSPAFLKRGHFLASSYDPFAEEADGFPDNERRKKTKFGRGSGQWRFAERTPSPEEEELLFAAGLISPSESPTQRAISVNVETENPPTTESNGLRSKGLHKLGGEEELENPEVFLAEQIPGSEATGSAVALPMPQTTSDLPAPKGSLSPHASPTMSPLPSEDEIQLQKDVKFAGSSNKQAEIESPQSVVSATSSSKLVSASNFQAGDHSGLISEEEKSDAVALSRPASDFGLDGSVFSRAQRGPEFGLDLSEISEETTQQRAAVDLLNKPADGASVPRAKSNVSEPEIATEIPPVEVQAHESNKDDTLPHSESDSLNSVDKTSSLLPLPSSRQLQIPEPQKNPKIHASDLATTNVDYGFALDEENPKSLRGVEKGLERTSGMGGREQTSPVQAQDPALQNLGIEVDFATHITRPTNVEIIDLEDDEENGQQLSQKQAQSDALSFDSSYAEIEGSPIAKAAEGSVTAKEQILERKYMGNLTNALRSGHEGFVSTERDQQIDNAECEADTVTEYMTEVPTMFEEPTNSLGDVNGDLDVEAPSSVEEKPPMDVPEGRENPDKARQSNEQILREEVLEAEASERNHQTFPKHDPELPSVVQDSYEATLKSQLVTPDATQETSFGSQPSSLSLRPVPDDDTLPTPRPTQGTSAGILPPHSPALSKSVSSVQQLFEPTVSERVVPEQSSQLTFSDQPSQPTIPEQSSQLTVLEQSLKQEESANTVLHAMDLDPEKSFRRKKLEETVPPQTPRRIGSSLIQRLKEIRSQSSKKSRSHFSDGASAVSPWFAPRESSPAVPDRDAESEMASSESDQESRQIEPSDTTTQGNTLAKSFIRSPPPRSTQLSTTSSPSILPPSQPTAGGFRTNFSYFAPLASLSSHYGTMTDVIAIAISATSVTRAKSGARDYNQTIYITDTSSNPPHTPISVITAQIFRARKDCFPLISLGDAILLRNFTVQSFEKRVGLLSTDTSAWAVFRRDTEVQIRGPPVEFGPEERAFARGHWNWWDSLSQDHKDELVASVPKEKTQRKGIEGLGVDLAGFRPKSTKSKLNGSKSEPQSRSNKLSLNERSLTLNGPAESDQDKAQTQRRVLRPRNGRGIASESPEKDGAAIIVEHELRDGTKYIDSSGVRESESQNEVHELRDGTKYTDSSGVGESESQNEVHELRDGTKYTDSSGVGESESQNEVHELRDGRTYRDRRK